MDHSSIGTRIGDYTIESVRGTEPNGVVYEATHLVLPRKACLKVMAAPSREGSVQLLREACLLEALFHRGIPRVFECGVLADKRAWFAFERIDGDTLADRLASGCLPLGELVAMLRDVAEILQHAHARGVVHRGLVAESIVCTQPTLRIRGWDRAGTVDSVQHLDARDDVYALGSIAFRALTGCLHTPAVLATEWCPTAPGELTALIDVMLDANARVRPTCEEIAERARWLATTVDAFELVKPRWTPPNGLDRDTHEPLPPPVATASFSIRIARTRSS